MTQYDLKYHEIIKRLLPGGTWWNCLKLGKVLKRVETDEVKELYGSSMELELLQPVQENHTEVRQIRCVSANCERS